jgi:hypothetical protein
VNNMHLVIKIINILHKMDKCHDPQRLYKKEELGLLRNHIFAT